MKTALTPLLLSLGLSTLAGPFASEACAQTWARSYESADPGFLDETCARSGGGSMSVGHLGTNFTRRRGVLHVLERTGALDAAFVASASVPTSFNDVAERQGHAVVCGTHDAQPWIAEFDPVSGQPQFQFRIGGEAGSLESLESTSDGGLVAVGSIETADQGRDVLVVRLDRFFSIEWMHRYGGDRDDRGYGVVSTNDGGCVVAADTRSFDHSAQRVWMLALDRNGALLWNKVVEEAGTSNVGTSPSIARLTSGDLVTTWGGGKVLCVDPGGTLRWKFDLDPTLGGSFETARGTSDGACVLGGTIYTPNDQAWMAKVSADGVVQWERILELGEYSYLYGSHEAEADCIVAVAYNETATGSNPMAIRVDAEGNISQRCDIEREGDASRNDLDATLAVASSHVVSVPFGGTSFVDLDALPTQVVDICVSDAHLSFVPYGQGSPGSGAKVPLLQGQDGYSSGDLATVEITEGLGGARVLQIIGFAPDSLPFAGGELLVDMSRPWIHIPLRLSGPDGSAGAGAVRLPIRGDYTPFIGIDVYTQSFVLDPAAQDGFALSNGLQGSIR